MVIYTQDFRTKDNSPLCLSKNFEYSNIIKTSNTNEGNLL